MRNFSRTKVEEERAPLIQEIARLNSTEDRYIMVSSESMSIEDVSQYIEDNRTVQVYIYCGLVGILFVVSLIRNSAFLNVCLNSSIELHRRLFKGVLRAGMSFFEMNPAGRVLNRFAKDIGIHTLIINGRVRHQRKCCTIY